MILLFLNASNKKQGNQISDGRGLGQLRKESHFNAGTEGILSATARRGPAWGCVAGPWGTFPNIEAFIAATRPCRVPGGPDETA